MYYVFVRYEGKTLKAFFEIPLERAVMAAEEWAAKHCPKAEIRRSIVICS